MLTKSVLDSIQEAAGLATFAPAAPTSVLQASKAANSNRYEQSESMIRRNRRVRRAERNAMRSTTGWTVRMW